VRQDPEKFAQIQKKRKKALKRKSDADEERKTVRVKQGFLAKQHKKKRKASSHRKERSRIKGEIVGR